MIPFSSDLQIIREKCLTGPGSSEFKLGVSVLWCFKDDCEDFQLDLSFKRWISCLTAQINSELVVLLRSATATSDCVVLSIFPSDLLFLASGSVVSLKDML